MAFSGKVASHCHCRFCSTKIGLNNFFQTRCLVTIHLFLVNHTYSAIVLGLGDGSARGECLRSLDTGAGPKPSEDVALALLPPDDRLLDEQALGVGLSVHSRSHLAGENEGILKLDFLCEQTCIYTK